MDATLGASAPAVTVESLRDHGPAVATAVSVLPVVGTALAMIGLFVTVGPSPFPKTATLVYGVANLVVGVGLFVHLSGDARRAVFRYRRPARREVAASVGLAIVAVVVVAPVVVRGAAVVGVPGGPAVPAFDSTLGAVVVAVVSVVIAPVVEEVLFRGYLFGVILSRHDVWIAGIGSSAVFGAIHLFLSGLPGVVEAFLIGLGFVLVRHRYDNLAGVGIAHALINGYYVAAGLGALPSLVAG